MKVLKSQKITDNQDDFGNKRKSESRFSSFLRSILPFLHTLYAFLLKLVLVILLLRLLNETILLY